MKEKSEKNAVWVEIGSKLWKFRNNLELTQDALGEKFSTKRADKWKRDYTKRTIQGYESGENEPSGELLFNIWKAGYSIDALFSGIEPAAQVSQLPAGHPPAGGSNDLGPKIAEVLIGGIQEPKRKTKRGTRKNS